jgi:hypothetical protein
VTKKLNQGRGSVLAPPVVAAVEAVDAVVDVMLAPPAPVLVEAVAVVLVEVTL